MIKINNKWRFELTVSSGNILRTKKVHANQSVSLTNKKKKGKYQKEYNSQ